MKYIVRVIKYFVYITMVMALILAVLAALGLISTDVNVMFREGWTSVWKILLMFFVVSLVYPRFGYTRRSVNIPGSYDQIRDGVVGYMEEHGYKLSREEGENLTFTRKPLFKNQFVRIRGLEFFNEPVVFERDFGGFTIDGATRKVARLASGLEFKFRNPEGEA